MIMTAWKAKRDHSQTGKLHLYGIHHKPHTQFAVVSPIFKEYYAGEFS